MTIDSDEAGRVTDAVTRFAAALSDFDAAISDNIEGVTWETAASLLRVIRHEVGILKGTGERVERYIIDAHKTAGIRGEVEVPDVGVVTVRRTANRKSWDNEGASRRLVDAHMVAAGGEVPDPWEVRTWLMDAIGVGYWRLGALRAMGIDPDDYCHKELGRRVVDIVGGPEVAP